jgi:hypothetical protein
MVVVESGWLESLVVAVKAVREWMVTELRWLVVGRV